ncbi:MAG TPA: hypothetical protein VNI61_01030 [Gemmatimonadales bacterium]|nr:hypothetical protein [Gemmatimonadales bacterium]
MTPRRHILASVLLHLGLLASGHALFAQVGHDPAASPYRDIPRGGGPVVSVGYLTGERGRVAVGLTNALMVGARYDVQVSGALRATFGLTYGMGERFLIDPTKDSASRKSGPEDDGLLLADGELQLLITGHKTWRGFAPHVSAGLGVAMGGAEPAADTSDYAFGTKFLVQSGAGVRWYPARRLNLQLEGRVLFWKLRYPAQYYAPASDGTSVLRFRDPSDEWTRQAWVRIGLGWTF